MSRKIRVMNKKTGEMTLAVSTKSKVSSRVQRSKSEIKKNLDEVGSSHNSAGNSNKHSYDSQKKYFNKLGDKEGECLETMSKKKPRQEIETLEDFIAYGFSRKGQPISINAKRLKMISGSYDLDQSARGRLLSIAKNDFLLAVPRQLLLAAREIEFNPPIRSKTISSKISNNIRGFVRDLLTENPVFLSSDMIGVLQNSPDVLDGPDARTAITMQAKLDYSKIEGVARGKVLKSKELEKLRINSVYTLAIWLAETRNISVDKIGEYLSESLWFSAATVHSEKEKQLRTLTEIHDLAGVGFACQIYKKKMVHLAQIVESGRKKQEAVEKENSALHQKNEFLQEELTQSEKRINNLAVMFEAEKRDHVNTRLHLQDDIEKMRTRLLRRLKAEVNLIAEGLHAIRREPPKIHVMDDHAERAIDGLKDEITKLGTED